MISKDVEKKYKVINNVVMFATIACAVTSGIVIGRKMEANIINSKLDVVLDNNEGLYDIMMDAINKTIEKQKQ